MNLLELLGEGTGQAAVGQIARQLGINERDAQQAMKVIMPAMGRGVQRNVASSGGLDALVRALGTGQHDRYVDRPESIAQPEAIADGNAILGHIFGSKDVSRNVAGRAASESGINSDLVKKMLPMLATVAMGMLSKNTNQGRQLQQAQSGGSAALDLLNQVLDSDGDGSAVDDMLSLAQRFF